MNNVLSKPIGIDYAIQHIQNDLYRELSDVWEGNIVGYGRVEKTPLNNGEEVPEYYHTSKIVIPEWYNSNINEYEEVYYDDNNAAQFCFLVSDLSRAIDDRTFKNRCKIAFMVDLSKIYPSEKERLTSIAHRDVLEIIREYGNGYVEIDGIETRIDVIFREYKTTNIKFDDMHPLHCFAVVMDLVYNLDDKC